MGHVYNCLFSLLDNDCSNIVNFGFVSAFFFAIHVVQKKALYQKFHVSLIFVAGSPLSC